MGSHDFSTNGLRDGSHDFNTSGMGRAEGGTGKLPKNQKSSKFLKLVTNYGKILQMLFHYSTVIIISTSFRMISMESFQVNKISITHN